MTIIRVASIAVEILVRKETEQKRVPNLNRFVFAGTSGKWQAIPTFVAAKMKANSSGLIGRREVSWENECVANSRTRPRPPNHTANHRLACNGRHSVNYSGTAAWNRRVRTFREMPRTSYAAMRLSERTDCLLHCIRSRPIGSR